MEKLFLLDAYALIYRAYYAFIKNPRINSKGVNTSAIMGFCNTLHEVISKEKPTYLAVAFDPHGLTFRSEAFPAYKAQSGDDFTRITLFPKKKVSEMTREERIAVCYQYTCLLYEDGQAINNQTVRERFNLNKNQTVMASRILADTLESGLIKMKDPETESKRYSSYIPYYG